MLTTIISLAQVDVRLGIHHVLHDITCAIEPGEQVALIGANGSGKSTLIKTLCGLNPIASGTLTLFGTPIGSFADWAKIGWVPQAHSPALLMGSVDEIVASGRVGLRRFGRRQSQEDREAIDWALTQTAITDLRKRCFGSLSGGQRQRVLIARALASKPALLLLDEPLTGVDVTNQERIAQTLTDLAKGGVTICAAVHGHSPLSPLFTRSITLHEGRIIADQPGMPETTDPREDCIHPEVSNHHD